MFFERYLRFLLFLFSSMAVVCIPTIGAWNYLASQSSQADLVTRMTWSGSAPKSTARFYWLYAMAIPCFAAYVLTLASWELRTATQLMSKLRGRDRRCSSRALNFWVAITNLPPHLQTEEAILAHYPKWNTHMTLFIFQRASVAAISREVQNLVRTIERHETKFIVQMVRLYQTVKGDPFGHKLATALAERHGNIKLVMDKTARPSLWSWLPYHIQPVSRLYPRLLQLGGLLRRKEAQRGEKHKNAVLVAFNRDYVAQAFVRQNSSDPFSTLQVQYLGLPRHSIFPLNLRGTPWVNQARRESINLLMVLLITLWTIPVGACGVLSQLNVAISWWQNGKRLSLPTWFVGILEGVIPQLAASFLMSTFPHILRSLVAEKRYLTAKEVQNSTQHFYFWFLFTQLILTPSLSSGLVPALAAIADNGILTLPRTLAQNLPLASTYFISYSVISAITFSASTLTRLPSIVKLFLVRRNCQTPRDQVDQLYRLHDSIMWGELYPRFTMMANIGRCEHIPGARHH